MRQRQHWEGGSLHQPATARWPGSFRSAPAPSGSTCSVTSS